MTRRRACRSAAKSGHESSQDLAVGFLEFGGCLWWGFVRLLIGLNEGAHQAEGGGIAGGSLRDHLVERGFEPSYAACLAVLPDGDEFAQRPFERGNHVPGGLAPSPRIAGFPLLELRMLRRLFVSYLVVGHKFVRSCLALASLRHDLPC